MRSSRSDCKGQSMSIVVDLHRIVIKLLPLSSPVPHKLMPLTRSSIVLLVAFLFCSALLFYQMNRPLNGIYYENSVLVVVIIMEKLARQVSYKEGKGSDKKCRHFYRRSSCTASSNRFACRAASNQLKESQSVEMCRSRLLHCDGQRQPLFL